MISIVTAYYNRKQLFYKTLRSIERFEYSEPFEFIAVDDGSIEEERIEDLAREFPFLKVIRLEKKNKWYQNSCIPFNEGFRHAKGDKIIIQNPECYHFSNVIEFAGQNLKNGEYLSFGCFALDKKTTDHYPDYYPDYIINDCISQPSSQNSTVEGNIWYNHSVYKPHAYHFCVALAKKDLDKLQGFDELLSLGIAYDDNEFVRRVKNMLNIKFADNILVLHQNHYSPQSTSYDNRKRSHFYYGINNILFQQKLRKKMINHFTKNLSVKQKKKFVVPFIAYRLLTDLSFYKLLTDKLIKRI
jgi:glycosyltransferase involved in cell wall biosynthesis